MIGWILLSTLAPPVLSDSEAAEVASPPRPLKIDILVEPTDESCETHNIDEIVVCAINPENERQRLRPIANAKIYDKDESMADFGLSENIRMTAETDSEELGAGIISKRIMARMKIKF